MSRIFLTNIDLNTNQLLNAAVHPSATAPTSPAPVEGQLYFNTNDNQLKVYDGANWVDVGSTAEAIQDAINSTIVAGAGISSTYDDEAGTLTIANTGVTSVVGTDNEVTVSAASGSVQIGLPNSITVDVTGSLSGNATTASTLETSRTISLGGDLSGSVSFNGSQNVTITADIVADAVTLGTDTTGDYVASVSGSGDGISVTGSGEGGLVVISNTGVTSITSEDSTEIVVSGSAGNITIGLPDDVTIDGDLVVEGNLTVSGSVTSLNTETLLVEDNIVTLNTNVTGTPTANAGIEVERGDETNASIIWDESADVWKAGLSGSVTTISLEGHTHVASDVTDFDTAVDDEIDAYLTGSDSISISSGSIDATLATTSYLTKTGGLAVDISSVETKLVTDGFTKKATANLGNASATSFVVNHGLATRDVTVQVFRNAAPYDQVEADVLHYDAADTGNVSKITVSFASAPTTNQYRVVVIG
jgi:hypothetical protein